MTESGTGPSLRYYLHVARRGRWWLVVGALLGLGAGLGLGLTSAKQYTASAQLLVQSVGSGNPMSSEDQSGITTTSVQTELQLVTSAEVQDQVRAELGSAPKISAAEVGQTNVIAITAVGPDPVRAALIANTYARAFVAWSTATTISSLTAAENQLSRQINTIGSQIKAQGSNSAAEQSALSNQQAVLKGQLAQLEVAGATASTGLELVTPATVPTSPSSPKPVDDALLGLVIGLMLGVGAAALRATLDETVTTGESVERVSGLGVLATVPLTRRKKNGGPAAVAFADPTSQAAEAYRSLRTVLQFAQQERTMRTLLVTSPVAGEGKTSTVINLGTVFAQAGMRVVLVSCDLRRPGLDFIESGAGGELASVLRGKCSVEQAVVPMPDIEGLCILQTRTVVANPTELLGSAQMRGLIEDLSQRFDLVLIDSPPVLPVADAMILSSYADAVLLVVAARVTRRAELRHAVEKLVHSNAELVGAVLNKATAGGEYYAEYGSYQPYTAPAGLGRRHRRTGPASRSAGMAGT